MPKKQIAIYEEDYSRLKNSPKDMSRVILRANILLDNFTRNKYYWRCDPSYKSLHACKYCPLYKWARDSKCKSYRHLCTRIHQDKSIDKRQKMRLLARLLKRFLFVFDDSRSPF